MQNYYNPYNTMANQPYGMPSQQMAQPMMQQNPNANPAMTWVDGEIAARSFPIPPNQPAGMPYPIWDTNEQVIYLRAIDQFGRPTPVKKLRYTFEEPQVQNNLISGAVAGDNGVDTSQYATKADLDHFMDEIKKMFSGLNMNGQNRGPNNDRGGKQNNG